MRWHRLWSERYDREIEDVFAVQDEIAGSIAARMKATLQNNRGASDGQRATDNIDAYQVALALVSAAIGQPIAAIEFGREALRRHDPALPIFARSWDQTRFLRALPEFREIVAALNLPESTSEASRV